MFEQLYHDLLFSYFYYPSLEYFNYFFIHEFRVKFQQFYSFVLLNRYA